MKLYKTKDEIILEDQGKYFRVDELAWDDLFIIDHLITRLTEITKADPIDLGSEIIKRGLKAPIQSQEIWASGVTYINSKLGREEESKSAGGGQFYAHVYAAERPELFFKGTALRTVGPGGMVRIRKDSTWDVPEPELTLVINAKGMILGYTIGNDMSSRSIEGENPLYLPQAKVYDGSAALGPCLYITNQPLQQDTEIHLMINRAGKKIFEGSITLNQMKRKPEDLVSFLFRECSFPKGCFLMTGTGIVPGHDFTLQKGDEISITIEPIGTLTNTVG